MDTQKEAEERAYEAGHTEGVADMQRGSQRVDLPVDFPDGLFPGYLLEDELCHVRWYEEAGDTSVGIPDIAGWVIDPDKVGFSGLGKMLNERQQLMQALENVVNIAKRDTELTDSDHYILDDAAEILSAARRGERI